MVRKRITQALVLTLLFGLTYAPALASAQASKASATEKVNLNTATEEQLQTLPGIGPSVAKRIIDHRNKNGKFTKIEEILNIRGIGEKKFQRIKDRLVV